MRCFNCGQNGHRLSESLAKDAEIKGKGEYGKGFATKGMENLKGGKCKGSGKMGSFQSDGYCGTAGAKGVRRVGFFGAPGMQPFGVTENCKKVNQASATATGRAARVSPKTPPGLRLQSNDEEAGCGQAEN